MPLRGEKTTGRIDCVSCICEKWGYTMRNLSVEERKTILSNINQGLITGGLTLGQAAFKIRTELYSMSQNQYSKFIGLSEKTLRDIEKAIQIQNYRY